MSVAASLLSIVVFLGFAASAIQKLMFTTQMSQAADHLGYTKRGFRRIGLVELLGALGALAGLSAKASSFWGAINVAATAGLTLTMVLAVIAHLRKKDGFAHWAPAAAYGVVALLAMIFRLA